jgi:hypothetical protein
MRNQWANENNVFIRSFDSLAENVSKRYCADFFEGFSNESEKLSSSILNQLANPFVSAYTDREWRGITQDGRFQSGVHMVALNANLLTHSHKYSNKYSEFLSFDNGTRHNE